MALQLSRGALQGASGTLPRRSQAVVVRASSADNQLLKKPEARKAGEPEPPKKLFSEAPAAPTAAHAGAAPSAPAPVSSKPGVTIEFQRQRAKEMRAYFIEKKTEEALQRGQVFGWTKANEISNGRWVMFGLMVGMLTEYATGVDFIHQIGLMLSYMGVVDFD